jgi:hypothetical protein
LFVRLSFDPRSLSRSHSWTQLVFLRFLSCSSDYVPSVLWSGQP